MSLDIQPRPKESSVTPTIPDQLREGRAVLDADLRYWYCSPLLALLNGGDLQPEDYIGQTVEEAAPHIWPEVQTPLLHVLETGETWSGEIPVAMPDGSSRAFVVEYRPLLARDWPEIWQSANLPTKPMGIDASVAVKGIPMDPRPSHTISDALVELAVARIHRHWLQRVGR